MNLASIIGTSFASHLSTMNAKLRLAVISITVFACIPCTYAQVLLPGTQPLDEGIKFAKLKTCSLCHSKTRNGEADPYFSWQGGMMSQSARDPVYRAAQAIANQDVPGVGEYCIRCHAPGGWFQGRSTMPDGSDLKRDDLHGVRCDVCHQFVDPLSEEGKNLVLHQPPGYGNGMMVIDPANVMRGPYGDGKGTMPHKVLKSDYHAKSELCATCHDVSNPLFAKDVYKQPPHRYGHVERTYSEWLLSDFSKKGSQETCQSCHYPTVEGGGKASKYGGITREHFVMHGPVGGSTWVQDVTYMLWDGKDMSRKALEAGKRRARALLKTAARLEASFASSDKLRIKITNLTGHKLPTGYPEGRRMWVNVRYYDKAEKLLGEVGQYGETAAKIFGEKTTVSTLLDPAESRIYECKPGMSEAQARKHGKQPGPSFHFVLNDITSKDNRIPPRGFSNAKFEEHLCAPVGATYADGQHWDEFEIAAAKDATKAVVRLMYQSVSWEYIKFLAEENKSDDWGKRLYEAWQKTDRCPPEVMAEVTARLN